MYVPQNNRALRPINPPPYPGWENQDTCAIPDMLYIVIRPCKASATLTDRKFKNLITETEMGSLLR